jgi:hypothetical protein
MLQKVINAIMQKEVYKYNAQYAADMAADAEKIYSAGWDALPDGTVIQYKGCQVAVKAGDTIEAWQMLDEDWSVVSGKLHGDNKKLLKTAPLTEQQKQAYLAQSIITKYYTVPKM